MKTLVVAKTSPIVLLDTPLKLVTDTVSKGHALINTSAEKDTPLAYVMIGIPRDNVLEKTDVDSVIPTSQRRGIL